MSRAITFFLTGVAATNTEVSRKTLIDPEQGQHDRVRRGLLQLIEGWSNPSVGRSQTPTSRLLDKSSLLREWGAE